MRVNRMLARLVLGLTGLALASNSASGAYEGTDVTDGGSIRGKVTFTGPLPERAVEQLPIKVDAEVCGEGSREVRWVDVEDGALRGVFVFLEGIEKGKKWEEPEGGFVITHQSCRLTPWAQVVRLGYRVRNSDAVPHRIDAREILGLETGRPTKHMAFNLLETEVGDAEVNMYLRNSPAYIFVTCDIHDFEYGYLMASEHPYATVVDDKGEFTFDAVPPGTHKVKAWHPRLGFREVEVTVKGGAKTEAMLVF